MEYRKISIGPMRYELTEDYQYTVYDPKFVKIVGELDPSKLSKGHLRLRKNDDSVTIQIYSGVLWNGLTYFPDGSKWLEGSMVHDILLGENSAMEPLLDVEDAETREAIDRVLKEILRGRETDNKWSTYWKNFWSRNIYRAVKTYTRFVT